MFDNIRNEIIYFNSLEKHEKIDFICSKLSKMECEFQTQKFESSFGAGTNIVVFPSSNTGMPVTVLCSHYDGNSYYDNDCGTLALVQISQKIVNSKQNRNYVIVFTDQEESYQQGSYYFLKTNAGLEIELSINIDGFGIGEDIYTTDLMTINKSSMMFLTDSRYFKNADIKSISLFSSFQVDIEKSKKGDVYSVFKDYINATFFLNRFDEHNYNDLVKKLCGHIYLVR